jgi:hypothetical protein
MMSAVQAAELIEQLSDRFCRDHYRMGPEDRWIDRGPDRNDDRLSALVEPGKWILVTGRNRIEIYEGPMEEAKIAAYVRGRLLSAWTAL